MARILIVEDDRTAGNLAKEWLQTQCHVVDLVFDGNDGAELALHQDYDLMILDWELPGRSGLEIVKTFRARSGTAPIIFVTGRSSIEDKTASFEAGIDDYLTKPFELKELSLRVKALLRRPRELQPVILQKGGITLHVDSHKSFYQEVEVPLKPREFVLLEFLMLNANLVFSPEALRNKLWSIDEDIGDTGIRVLISRLRNKFGGRNSPVKNVYGVGYTFQVENS